MNLSEIADKYALAWEGSFRSATDEDIENLKKLKLPEELLKFYKTHTPDGTLYGFVNLLSIEEMLIENLGDAGPGRDVFPHGFVVFAAIDGDGFCFDVLNEKESKIVLFGHEEPLDFYARRDELLEEKGKIVASNLTEFLQKCLDETLDRDPRC